MSDNVIEYLGYQGSIETSLEDGILYGSIQHITDKITYESETVAGLKAEFEAAVDHYLEYCKQKGIQPDKPFSGTFNVRIGMDLHKQAIHHSKRHNTSLNELMKAAVAEYLNRHDGVHEIHHHHHYEVSGAFPMHSSEQHPPRLRPRLQVIRSH